MSDVVDMTIGEAGKGASLVEVSCSGTGLVVLCAVEPELPGLYCIAGDESLPLTLLRYADWLLLIEVESEPCCVDSVRGCEVDTTNDPAIVEDGL